MRDDEHRLQTACVRWWRLQYGGPHGEAARAALYAVPNGGRRDAATGARLKAEGVVAGVSDLNLDRIALIDGRTVGGLRIELKTPRGRQSPEQRRWQAAAERAGYRYVVVRSVEDFKREVDEYLKHQIIPWQE